MILDPKTNNSIVTVSGSYGTTETAVVLTAGQGALIADALASGQMNGVWWNPNQYPIPADDPNREIIRLTSVPANETINILRAQEGTTAKAHATGSRILFGLTKKDIDDLENKVLHRDLTKKETALDRIDQTWKSVLTDSTIVDVFVYDTRRDTIDPAWRFNSALSWYNEAASSTRGTKKEFPEVLIVVVSLFTVYMFDYETGFFWMKFDAQAPSYIYCATGSNTIKTAFMLNGKLYVGTGDDTAYAGLSVVSFPADSSVCSRVNSDSVLFINLPISGRNNLDYNYRISSPSRYPFIAGNTVKHISGTVINQKQFIAVATSGGVSVINENDSRVINSSDTSKFIKATISPDGYLYAIRDNDRSIYRSALKVQNMDWAGLAAFTLNDILTSAIYTGSKLVSYDGTDDVVSVSDNAAINFGTGDFTLQLSFITGANVTGTKRLVFKGASATGVGYNIHIYEGTLYLSLQDANGSNNVILDSSALKAFTKYQYAIVVSRTNSNVLTYKEGTLIKTTSISALTNTVTNTSALTIGGQSGSNYFNGKILNIRLWNYALSPSRIYDLAQGRSILADDKWGSGNLVADLTSWTDSSATHTANTITSVGSGGIYKNILTVGQTYILRTTGSTTASSILIRDWTSGDTYGTGFGQLEFVAKGASLYLCNNGGGTTTYTDFKIVKKGVVSEYLSDNYDSSTGTWKSTENAEGGASTLNAIQATAGYKPASVAMPDKYSITAFPKGLALGSNKQMAVAMNNVLAEFIITAAGTTTTNIVTTLTTADLIQYVEKYMLIESTGEIRQITAQTNGSNAQFTTAAFSAVPSGKAKILDSSVLEGGILLLSEIDV